MEVIRSIVLAAALLAPAAAGAEDAAAEQRGAYLVNTVMICGRCHTAPGPAGKPFAGGRVVETDMYKVQGSNITPDPTTGIGRWSDAEIARAITHGVRPDGSRMATAMPYEFYAVLTPADLDAVVAYLRSRTPVANALSPPHYALPPAPVAGVPGPPAAAASDATLQRGWYIGTLARCLGCHSTPDATGEADLAGGAGRGGMVFEGPWGTVTAPAITPAALTGWSDDDIRHALVEGVAPGGRKLAAPMQSKAYAQLQPEDLTALIAWIRSLPRSD
ncbi:c-type cytochrome [Ancylobacter terrae]|uniref:c-type cytochrome n=1 Tax=Ancylobacter sp. sgz301288 TaxID=3342077 RepID=UPI00385CC7D8